MKTIICGVAILLMGCSMIINIESATRSPMSDFDRANIEVMAAGQSTRNWEKIQLTVNSADLLRAMRSESTVFVSIIDCSKRSLRFPSVAFLGNIPLNDQQKKAEGDLKGPNRIVMIYGYAPTSFISQLKSICIELEGGSYMGSSLRSNLISVESEESR